MFALFIVGVTVALFFLEKALAIRAQGTSKKNNSRSVTKVRSPRVR
jgi:hypothetical protein